LLVVLAACGAAPAPGPTSGTGMISLDNVDSTTLRDVLLYARFTATPDETCASHSVIAGCTIDLGCNEVWPLPQGVSAGPIAVGIDGDSLGSQAPAFHGGETLTITASGDVIAPFSAMVIAPSEVTTSIAPTIDKTSDLALAWTGASSGSFAVGLSQGIDGDNTEVTCLFPADDGRGVVPKAALALLGGTYEVGFSTQARTSVDVDGWTIGVVVGFESVFADGSRADASVTVR